MSMYRFRDKKLANQIINLLQKMGLNICLMHVCGTHQDTLIRYGLDQLLRKCGITVRQGPGCPVCVTTAREFEEAMVLAKQGKIIATFGDAAKVPGKDGSLKDLRGHGYDIRIVYAIEDAVKLAAKTDKEVVFLGVGFETTAPSTAVTILSDPPKNFSVLSCHRSIPPALIALMEMGSFKIHGLIEPGHVSAIIGVKPYEELSSRYHIPQVVAGFEPLDMLVAVYMLVLQIRNNEAKVENEYSRVVQYEGNVKALQFLDRVFQPCDISWRGFPIIKGSGMSVKSEFEQWDARKKFEDNLREIKENVEASKGCKCGEVLRGLIDSKDCPLFRKLCTPLTPIGPCMVSVEGSCSIEYKYGSGSFSGHSLS